MPAPGQAQRAAEKFIVFENFEKMNTQSVRQALSEKELSWLENLQPIAGNNLTTVPAPLPPFITINETITAQYFVNLGVIDYIISFTSVGSGWATSVASTVRFAPPGTFSNPDATVWQSQYVLINDPTSGYCFWDGATFTKQGGVSPNLAVTAGGTGYTSVPTVAITGGSGSGATAVATIGSPQVSAVNVTAPGSQYQWQAPPGVVFTGGGGSGAAATANIGQRSVSTITITDGGLYNTTAVTVGFSGGGGSGAVGTVNMSSAGPGAGFFVGSISIQNGGSNYTSAPTLVFSGGIPARVATATCTVDPGGVDSITVTNPGSGYTSSPAISFSSPGTGTGATASAVVGGSGVVTLKLTNPGSGYLSSDVLTLTISGGGGSGATGTAQVAPFLPKGTTIAVFQGRVWLAGARILVWSGTKGFDDFAGANAAGALTLNDADLTHGIIALRNYNNYLFIMGDQSVKQIGNISLNAAGTLTLFTILTLSSDVGTIYPRSCGSFNRIFMFANSNGIWAVLGASVQKISSDLDGIFRLIDFTQQPQSAIADINGIHNITWLVRYKDPLASTRSILLTFDGKKWFVVSQGDSLVSITTASTLATGKTQTVASSGQDVTQILGDATTPVKFKLQTALTHHGNAVQRKKAIRNGAAVTTAGAVNMVITLDTNEGVQSYTHGMASGFNALSWQADGSGRYLGATITGTLANFTISNATIELQETNVGNK
jgi:hypothetical protein